MRSVVLFVVCPILLAMASVYGFRAWRGYKAWVRDQERARDRRNSP